MESIINDSGIHHYKLTRKDLLFLNTVSKNKEVFSKRQIKIAVKDRKLQDTLVFRTVKEVKWIIRSNNIQDCAVDTQHADNTKLIWGKDVPYQKWKTTRKNPIRGTEDLISVPKDFF